MSVVVLGGAAQGLVGCHFLGPLMDWLWGCVKFFCVSVIVWSHCCVALA